MRFVWRTALKDFHRHRRNPVEFAVWFGVPLAVGTLMVLASGGRSGPKPQAHVLVADEDDSLLSNFLVGAMTQEAAGGMMRAEAVGRADGRARLDQGEATALLIIPAGFSDAVLLEEPATLELITNPAQRILPGIVEEGLSILVDASFYAHRVVGEDLRAFAGGPAEGSNTFPDQQVADFSVRINRLVESLSTYLSPVVLDLHTSADADDETEEQPGFALLFLPGILYMSLLFMAQGLADDLWHEREQKTLRRLVVSPQGVASFLGGKLAYGIGLMFAVSLVALLVGYGYFELDADGLPLAVAWAAFSGGILLIAMMLLALYSASQRAANILTMVLIFPLMMLGGSFFPFEAMPSWMVEIGTFTPNGWALTQLKSILRQEIEPRALMLAWVGLLFVGCALFWLASRRLRAGFAQG